MKYFLAILCLFFGSSVCTQDSITVLSINLLEDITENNEEGSFDFFYLYDELQSYLKNPLNINTATQEDFVDLQMLSNSQIEDILTYRDQYGPFLSKYELQTISTLNIGTLSALLPLVTEGGERQNHTLKSILKESSSTAFFKWKYVLQDRKGFNDGSYLGDANHLFARYNFASGRNVRAGFTMEKDPGEQFFTGSNKKGFDYYTGFLYLRDVLPYIQSLNIGDYSFSMGQGLIAHNSFGGGKSSFVTNIKKGGRAIRPYSSVNEGNFFRGIATSVVLPFNTKLTFFGSRKKIDGAISQDSTIDTGFERFSSIIVNGFHRTESEIRKENSVSQTAVGGIVKYKKRNFHVAFNALHQSFSIPLKTDGQLYKKYRFTGDILTNLSIDYSYRYKNFNLFGEFARSSNGGTAFMTGLLSSLGRNIDLAFVIRDYKKDYQVLNANAFSESSQPINERGSYLAILIRPTRKLMFSTYVDLWKHPWLKFQKDAPSLGREFLFKLEYNEKRKFNAYIQYRYEEKQKNNNFIGDKIDPLITTGQHRTRLNVISTINKSLKLRNRLEFTVFNDDGELSDGYMIYQDIIYKPIGRPYSFTARYALFDTDGFDTRIYTYENDILYEFSIPFYADKGSRFYLNWRHKITRKLTLEARYSRTYYDNRESIGSAGQFIDGNVKSEVKLQAKYKF